MRGEDSEEGTAGGESKRENFKSERVKELQFDTAHAGHLPITPRKLLSNHFKKPKLSFILPKMEGLIPFVYKAIVQYENGNHGTQFRPWLKDSPYASYVKLPGDSGEFQMSDDQVFQGSEYKFSSSSASRPVSPTTQIIVSSGVQRPTRRLASRQVTASLL